ncbi:MAG: sigma 54-interacting transcriptional regulator [Chitinispirillaceae bacterium]
MSSQINRKTTVLFLGGQNSCRSLMAQGFAEFHAPDDVQIVSAGLVAGHRDVAAVNTMSQFDIDISQAVPVAVEEVSDRVYDIVVVICDDQHEHHPLLPGSPAVLYWHVSRPGRGLTDEPTEAYRKTAQRIRSLVKSFFRDGFFNALARQKKNHDMIMESLPVGVIAHDLKRRIMYFSPRAEQITGFTQKEIIGRDCHSVFVPSICGEQCNYFDGSDTGKKLCKKYQTAFQTRDGSRKDIDISLVSLTDGDDRPVGVVASLHDQTDLRRLEREAEQTWQFSGMIGQDHKMQQIYDLIKDLGESDFPVVVTGESGTGKELVARAIHRESTRRNNLFVPINCGALPEGTLESELFGHVKGAFTGAIRDKKGRFEIADGGTLFLDEVAELPLSIQVKLLRVLQEGTFVPVGSETSRTVDVRIISATNKNLRAMVNEGTFRDDLYYRLAVIPVEMPPLRERRNDIPMLASHILSNTVKKLGRGEMALDTQTVSILSSYDWPGNVRQLQNAIQFTMVKCHEKVILPEHLPPEILQSATPLRGMTPSIQEPGKVGRKPKLTGESVEFALKKAGGNKAKAARMLGVGRATLYNFINGNSSIGDSVAS